MCPCQTAGQYVCLMIIPYSLDQMLRLLFLSLPNLCGVYSRAASNREQRLLISVNLSLVPRPLPHFQCTDKADESDLFTNIEEDEDELEENELVLDDC